MMSNASMYNVALKMAELCDLLSVGHLIFTQRTYADVKTFCNDFADRCAPPPAVDKKCRNPDMVYAQFLDFMSVTSGILYWVQGNGSIFFKKLGLGNMLFGLVAKFF